MPYEILCSTPAETRLHLWPHRSLSQRGFVWFVGATALLIAVPLLAAIGSAILWALLPFLAATIWAIWFALRKNGTDRDIIEDLTLTRDRATLVRHGPNGARQGWEANSHWVRVEVHTKGGPVPNYLTLKGGPRIVEIGSFLSEDERLALYRELDARLAVLRSAVSRAAP